MSEEPKKLHWLVRLKTIKGLWVVGILVPAAIANLRRTIHPHANFGIEGNAATS